LALHRRHPRAARSNSRRKELLARTEDLLRQKQVLLQEMEHRVANSLQIIASILLMKARAVSSEETRSHLRDAHQRVMSVAAVQSHLHVSDGIDRIEVGSYLFKLCEQPGDLDDRRDQPIKIKVVADNGKLGSAQVVSIGLIVTELVINALKYAFPVDKPRCTVTVSYESVGTDWKLRPSRINGIGKAPAARRRFRRAALGTVIVRRPRVSSSRPAWTSATPIPQCSSPSHTAPRSRPRRAA
jgi:chemotaxis protein methyltransferase CheR